MKYRMKYFQCRETFATKRTKQVNLIEISSDECEFEHDLCNIFFYLTRCLIKCVRLIILPRYSADSKAFKYIQALYLIFCFSIKIRKSFGCIFFCSKNERGILVLMHCNFQEYWWFVFIPLTISMVMLHSVILTACYLTIGKR